MEFSLSKSQLQIYNMEKVIGGSICNITGSSLKKGDFDAELLEKAAYLVCKSNEALRIRIIDGIVPKQKVFPLDSEAIKQMTFETKEEFYEWARNVAKNSIGIQKNLCTLFAIKIKEGYGGVLIHCHHLITDAWTASLIEKQFFDYYNQLNKGLDPEIEENSYYDYINGEETYLASKKYEEDKKYWKTQYGQDINAKISHQTVDNYRATRVTIIEKRSEKINALCKKHGVSIYHAYMTALGMYIARENNVDSCCIGTALLNRFGKKERNTMGMYVNTVGICEKFNENTDFLENVRKVKGTIFDAMRHQKCNYVDAISSESGLGIEGMFDTYVSYQNIKMDNMETKWYFCGMQNNNLAVSISDWFNNGRLVFDYDYRVDVFTEKEIHAIHRHVVEIMINGFENAIPWNSIEVLPNWEKEEILKHWNQTDYDIIDTESVKSKFEELVKSQKDKLALVYGTEKLTYGRLNEKSNQIAHMLLSMGVGKDDFVCIIAERSCEMIEGILGILKAGGAYVPIAKQYPKKRIEYIINDCQPKAVLLFSIEQNFTCSVPVIDLGKEKLDSYSVDNPQIQVEGTDLAYAIYTSGTTGTPKGVMVEHKSVVSFCTYCQQNHFQKLLLDHCDYVLASSNIAFDIHLQEIELPLLNGKTVLLNNEESECGFAMLEEILEQYDKIAIITTPTLMKARLNSTNIRKNLKHVSLIMAGAESFPAELLEQISLCSDAIVINGYGPTETTCGVLYDRVTDINHITIGKPIANTKAYVINQGMLCGYGMTGELYLAGVGLARGYINLEQQTKEVFLNNIFDKGRMYRTGDLVKLGCDGKIQYCGRIDEQVKIRGFRIELEEIRNALLLCEGVKDGVIDVRGREFEEPYLAAFFTADIQVDTDRIRVQLAKTLPDYMVPVCFMQIEKIPVNSSGKIDRKQLPETVYRVNHYYVEPETEMQKAVAKAFCEVLHLEKVGLEDSFFEVGGDSIKALLLATYLREHQIDAHVSDIIHNKSVRMIAATLEEISYHTFSQEPIVGKVTMTPLQMEFFKWKLEKPEHFNQSVLVEVKEKLDMSLLQESALKLLEHHDMLRARVVDNALEIQNVEAVAEFEVKLYKSKDEELERNIERVASELQAAFQFGKGVLFQMVLFVSECRTFLFLSAHHLIVDGFSWKSILEDLEALYRKRPIPNKQMSFSMWGDKLREYSQMEIIEQEISYWKSVAKKIQTGYENRKYIEGKYSYAQRNISIPVKLEELEEQNAITGFRMEEYFLWKVVIGMKSWLRRDIFTVFMESSGREYLTDDVQLENTVGWFTNIYPVVLQVKNRVESIRTVKDEMRSVQFHGIGYGICKDILNIPDLQCEADFAFNYLGDMKNMLHDGSMFVFSDLPCGEMVANENKKLAPIVIDCSFAEDKLIVNLGYNQLVYSEDEIDKFVEILVMEIEQVDCNCTELQKCKNIPLKSDFYQGYLADEDFQKICGYYGSQEIEKIADLTKMQEAMVYYKMLDETSRAYFIQNGLSLSGAFDQEAAKESVQLLAYKHPILRSRICYKGLEKPYCVQLKNAELEVSIYENIDAQIVMQDDLERGFDLEHDSLLRVAIIHEKEDRYKLVWSFHHSIIDGWCMDILYRDFINNYKELTQGIADFSQIAEHAKKDVTYSYFDYLEYRKRLDYKKGLDYWKDLLQDCNESAQILPFDKGRRDGNVGTRIRFCSKELTEKLKQLARKNNVTLNAVLETAWGLFLIRYSGIKDVVFGKTVSGRDARVDKIEELVGLFINTVPVRVSAVNDMEICELIEKMQEQSEKTSQYDYCSLAEIQKVAGLNKDFITSLFVYENYEFNKGVDKKLEGISISIDEVREQTDYDLSLAVSGEENLKLRLLYKQDIYSEEQVTLYLNGVCQILESMVQANIKVEKVLYSISEKDKEQVLYQFNQSRKGVINQTVADLLKKQFALQSERIAVSDENRSITYHELEDRAKNVAAVIQAKGYGKNNVIAVVTDRTIDAIVLFTGVMLSGAAFLPVDPEFPKDRITFMLEDCKPVLILNAGVETDFTEYGVETLNIQTIDASYNYQEVVIDSNDLSYIIYTSGTTGKPKGVLIEQAGVANLAEYFIEDLEISPGMNVLQYHNFIFDGAIWEIIMGLCTGGTLYIIPREIMADAYEVRNYILKNKIQVAALPPQLYLQQGDYELDTIITAGSLAVKEVVEKAQFSRRYINSYGPTEGTVCATHWLYEKGMEIPDRIPIGKPIANKCIYILNGVELCGVGMIGELCIGGCGLARGYQNLDGLTKEKFIENPYGEGRLYRTGDLARWLPDGNIEYLGRIDEQVKIRGFRVELSEVENVIRKQNEVQDAVVIAKQDENGEPYLVAYVVSAEQDLDITVLIEKIRKELPEYMIPAGIMKVDYIPMTRNGKVDRKALPEIVFNRKRTYIAPTNDTEEKIVSIFEKILSVDRIGVEDDFFELGGHSLRAARLANEIESIFHIRIPLKVIFENSTPSRLVQILEQHEKAGEEDFEKATDKQYYKMSSNQKRIYFVCGLDESKVAYNIPLGMQIKGTVDRDVIEKALNGLVKRHESLRTSFHEIDGEYVQEIHNSDEVQLSVEYQEKTECSEAEKLEQFKNFVRPFDLSKAPLIRMMLLKTAEQEYSLFIDIHHIIADGASIKILLQDFSELYNGYTLPTLDRQYKDYSEWMENRDLEEQKKYWISQFQDEVPLLELPLDFSRPQQQSFHGKKYIMHSGKSFHDTVKNLGKQFEMTDYMVLLAGFMVLLGKYSRQSDIVVGTTVSGRTNKNVESILGMFANTIAIRGKIENDKPFVDFLEEIKENCFQAYENQEYPFEQLLEEIEFTKVANRNPLFDVMFVMQNNEMPEVKLLGVSEVNGIILEDEVAKFDLTVSVNEARGEYELIFEYCDAIFTKESIATMAEHYKNLMMEFAENPDKKLGQSSGLSEEEKTILVHDFNNNRTDYSREKNVAKLFEEQVQKSPDAVAIEFGNNIYTYRQLNEKAEQFAARILEEQVNLEDCVVVLGERSYEIIAAIIGILKAGCAYVPIDVSYPEERIRYIIKDCKPKLIICDEEFMTIDDQIPRVSLFTQTLPDKRECMVSMGASSSLAYIIYTSGTTGKPKGTLVENKSIVRLVNGTNFVELSENSVIFQTGAMAFDASTFEIWGALLNGGRLVLAEKDAITNLNEMKKIIIDKHVNTMWMTSTLFNQMVDMDVSVFETLTHLLIGGEKLSEKHVKKFYKNVQTVQLINGYGPTENTTFTATYPIPADFSKIWIGKPIANTQIYIMNGDVLCGIGMPGELCTTGDGVARGYLNFEGLTDEKFVKNPFGDGRMYRTGDLARWTHDGNIEYLGRIDEQVKIRGFRIELEEIENAIKLDEEIDDASVIVRMDSNGEKYIAAYLSGEKEISITALKERLKKILPDYMIPAGFKQLEKLPVNQNGKIDKTKLPEFEFVRSQTYKEAKTQTEKEVVDAFCRILNLEKVGVDDNFFDLGGHSLKTSALINDLEARTGIHIPIKEVYYRATPALIAEYLEENSSTEYITILPAEKKDYYPMSVAQRRLYVSEQIADMGVANNMPSRIKLHGALNIEKVQEVLQELVNRHEVLRTSFCEVEGELVQCIQEYTDIKVEYIKLDNTDEDKVIQLFRDFVRPFDLSKTPLMRCKIVEVDENDAIIFFDMHHIIGDGHSMNIIMDEFNDLYNGKTLKDQRIQYKDYSEWMRMRDFSSQREFWLNQMQGDLEPINLPLDYKRTQYQTFRGDSIFIKSGKELRSAVQKLAEYTGASEYMILLSVYMVLLGKYDDKEDFIVGSPVSGRTHKDTENVVGMFVNTLAMRGKPEKNKTFLEFLGEMKEMCVGAFENQEYPFDELLEDLDISRETSRNPLFDLMFVFQNGAQAVMNLNGIEDNDGFSSEVFGAKFDMTVNVNLSEDGYHMMFEYNTDLFKKANVEYFAMHFVQLLKEIVSVPGKAINEYSGLSRAEREQVVGEFNQTYYKYDETLTISQLFEQQVKEHADHPAVFYENTTLSYQELYQKALHIADTLQNEGIGRNDFVALLAERSTEMIIGIYGIILSGAAFVPLDPEHPEERINFILKDCQAKALIVTGEKFADVSGISVFKIEDICEQKDSLKKLENQNQPEDLLYMIYTSGTTGKPKGVMVEHGGVVNMSMYFKHTIKISDRDNVLQLHNYIFDGAVWEIMMALTTGACLFVVPKDICADPDGIKSYIQEHGITVAALPPQVYMQQDNYPIEKLITAGSEASYELVQKAEENASIYINSYGPTECTVCATHWEHRVGEEIPVHIPIGKPIINKQVYILRKDGICGIGMPGEICIAGKGLARGYFKQEQLTHEKFTENPFGEGRLYHTGDLARWLPDGTIEYLGRIDQQVKIRGFRVELLEIETLLRNQLCIADAAVIARKDEDGENHIVAYVIAKEGQKVEIRELKKVLSNELPFYMMPAAIIEMDKIPMTTSGKVDVKRLPEVDWMELHDYVEPRTEEEKQIAEIFSHVLKVDRVGAKDNFFELGGHSLKAIKVVNELEMLVGKRLVLKEFFENPTVEMLAKKVFYSGNETYEEISKAPEKTYYPMSSVQRRLYMIHEMTELNTAYNTPAALLIPGKVDMDKVHNAFQTLVERHEILRTRFDVIGKEHVQIIEPSLQVKVEYEKNGEMTKEQQQQKYEAFIRPFDLHQVPLIRMKVLEMESQSLLMVDMHHIISDGQSIQIFLNEFSQLYMGIALRENRLQYKDYSEWMNARNLDGQRKYWLNQFAELPEILDLGTDYPRPQKQEYDAALFSVKIEKEIREKIIQFSTNAGTTEYITLVSMVMLLLSKYSRQTDITIGSPFSGRTHYDVQNLLGMFVNTLVLRGNTDPEKTFETYMNEIQKMCMDAMENQDYPFEELVEETAVVRDMARNPLFDVLFTYQSNEQVEGSGLAFPNAEILQSGSTKAKFDISIIMVPNEDGYELVMEYVTNLFNEKTIEGMAGHLKNLLEGISTFSQKQLKDISLLSDAEEVMVRDTFNQTTVQYKKDATIISLWQEQVKKHQSDVAIVAKDGSYTYEELENASNKLAYALRDRGVKKDDIVTIVHSRKRNMLVAMLGILKAGAGYLPVDPTLPEERIRFMLEDSQSKFVITDDMEAKDKYENVLFLDTILKEYEGKEAEVNASVPDGIGYIIYTSGSTGKPKGTVLSNQNLMNFCSNNIEVIQAIRESGYLKMVSTTTVAFDIFVTESLLCLTNGITVVLADEEEQNNQKQLAKLVEREGHIAMQTTPSKMKAFMYDRNNLAYLKKMMVIILGGEEFPDALYEEMRKYTDAVIFNIYGPSETTVWITTKKIENEKVTIGKPFSNTQIYILEKGNLCGIGVPGELCIAGDSVGYGYLNRKELTQEKFVPNPFGSGLMYHSGDIAKWKPDGSLVYLGRMDDQVKIHGLRIELKEIEKCMGQLDCIKNVAVVVKEVDGDKRLCAYYVSEQTVSNNDIKAQLRKMLPEYMVPLYMMQLDEIPRNTNGKLDRKALPEIEGGEEREVVKPRNEMERIVVKVFTDILGLKEISIYDSFFEMGGNSLKVATLINQLEQETGVRISFKQIFTETTPESIAKLLEQAGKEEIERIVPAEKKNVYSMSPAQRRIFIVQKIDKQGVTYHMPTAMEIRGTFDIVKANRAFQKLIAKHESLRTSFHQEGDDFVQKIHETVTGGVEYEEYTDTELDEKLLMKEFVKPFDLEQAPLVRAKVVKIEERYILMFDMHHIISDGGSIAILVEEFCKAYSGEDLSPLRVQYKDYSEWLLKKDLNKQKEYWVNQFNDNIPILDLPYDHPRAKTQSYKGSAASASTDLQLVQKVEQIAKETGTTEYMVLLSVFMMLLGKYSRQDDIIVGTPVSGRVHADTESIIGMFVNTLAMRSFPEVNKKYRVYLDEIKEMCLMAFENQEYPFEELVEQVRVERDLSRNPLFDVMFVLQNNKEAVLTLDNNTQIKEMEPDYTVSKFDIIANVKRSSEGYLLVFEYCTSLFEQQSMELFIQHYLNLLEAVVNEPDRKLGEYSELGQEEFEQIQAFNDTEFPAAEGVTVLELFEEQVRKTPNNIAVEYQNESITYQEFNEKVNQLAYQLRDMGVKPDEFVCIIAKRSIQMMIGIFAVIKAGGAYVPIDANYPEDRIRYIIQDCKTKVVLLAKVEMDIEVDVPVIDLMDESIYHGNTENPIIINKPTDLIYLIYTSGTTGQPKGVMNTREGCTNYMRYRQAEHALHENDRVLQKTTYTFDVSVWEIIWWSTTGARVIMLEQGDEKDVEAICNEIYRKGITVMHFVPSMLQVFVSHLKLNTDERYKVTSLEAVYASGEALNPDTVKTFHEVLPETTDLINLYGPTEASIDVTRFNCDKDYEKILIGKPIHNTQIYILNGMALCGIGVPGELGIAGKGLARGYLNRDDLTSEKFINNPFGKGKLYRTGDLARLLPDGNIEYLGRLDEQVKIRGFRIELGEIENVIRKQENVRDVAVVARVDDNGEKFIAAYVVRNNPEQKDFYDLKIAIRSTLPEYMVPAAFMQIESIPVTKNGKLDKRALPQIERVSQREYVEPVTPEQKMLAKILSEILGVQKVGLTDDFYELGGDSIKAIRVVSKLREVGYKLDVKEIMQERTLEGMVTFLGQVEENVYEQGEVIGEVFITPIVQEFHQWNMNKREHFNQCIMLKADGAFKREALLKALEAVWKHHDMLRSVLRDGKQHILSSDEIQCELAVYDFKELTMEQAREVVKEQCNQIQRSFVLDKGPLMKTALYQVDGEEHLFICIHHLTIDGVSWRVLLEDLMSAYGQYTMSQTIELPRKTASYQLWAEALHEFAGKENIRVEIPYWNKVKEQIGKYEFKTVQQKQYQTKEILFTKEETDVLLHEAITAYNMDIKDLLMTSLSRTIHKVFGKEKLIVLMEGHGREEIHKKMYIDRTVGWFTSIYPVITEFKEDLNEHIIFIKEMFRKVPKNGFGLGLLKHLDGYEFDVKGDITFNYLGEFGNEISEDSEIGISNFDFGVSSAPENEQMTDLTVNGSISSGTLILDVTYNAYAYSDIEIDGLVEKFKEEIMHICNYCCGIEETVTTASDIGAGDMDTDELSALLDLLQ